MFDTYNYDAYGKQASSTGSTYNPFGYTGEYTDQESGLVYLRARYYDPSTQQFLSRDPLEGNTQQAYAYGAGSPNNYTDPSGECPFCIAGGLVAVNTIMDVARDYMHDPCGFDLGNSLKESIRNQLSDPWTWLMFLPIGELGEVSKLTELAEDAGKFARFASEAGDEASNAKNAVRLGKQLASEQQMAEAGQPIIGAGTKKVLNDAGRLADTYGSAPEDWAKMTSKHYTSADGTGFETHWYENLTTGQRVEPKTKIDFVGRPGVRGPWR